MDYSYHLFIISTYFFCTSLISYLPQHVSDLPQILSDVPLRHVSFMLNRKNIHNLLCRNTASYWNVQCVVRNRISPWADIEL